jgi:hypothetical protein
MLLTSQKDGWRINDNSVASLITALTETAGAVNWATATVILQLFDNSAYMVSGPGAEKFLPRKDKKGTYHIEGSLAVADKAAVKDLVARLSPLLKELGECRKIVLTPLARYWVSPCCEDVSHHINYRTPGYLPRLGDAVCPPNGGSLQMYGGSARAGHGQPRLQIY